MKPKAATALLVAMFVIVALALGVANKIRADRRAKAVAESLNRRVASEASIIRDGRGVVSTSEPALTDADWAKASVPRPASPGKTSPPLDLQKLRQAIQAGDVNVAVRIQGNLRAEDAGVIFGLLAEIPADLDEQARTELTSALVKLLFQIASDESSNYLLILLLRGGIHDESTRTSTMWHLGMRHYGEASPYIEGVAFRNLANATTVDVRRERFQAVWSLINMDSSKYIPRICAELSSVPETNLWCLVMPFELVAQRGEIDIAPAIRDLQLKFKSLPGTSWTSKVQVATVLARYAVSQKSSSVAVNKWLLSELNGQLESGSASGDDRELEGYREVLRLLQSGKKD